MTAAMSCPDCRAITSVGDRYCEACGHELARPTGAVEARPLVAADAVPPCAACGATAPPVDGYCSSCGAKAPDPRDHEERSYPGVGAVSDKGRRHHRNEDAMALAVEPGVVLAVVCDGVSTTIDPHVASLAAVNAALAELVAGGGAAAALALDAAFTAARTAVLAVPFVAAADLGPPSCTFLAAVITDDRVDLASLGDCRAYWLGDDGPRSLTRDDSWAAEQVEAGLATLDEAYADPKAHMITRWIGADADPTWRPAVTSFTPPGGGRVALCSDGLWNYTLHPETLAAAANNEPDPLEMARGLTAFANRAGGADNITVVIVDLPLPKGD